MYHLLDCKDVLYVIKARLVITGRENSIINRGSTILQIAMSWII